MLEFYFIFLNIELLSFRVLFLGMFGTFLLVYRSSCFITRIKDNGECSFINCNFIQTLVKPVIKTNSSKLDFYSDEARKDFMNKLVKDLVEKANLSDIDEAKIDKLVGLILSECYSIIISEDESSKTVVQEPFRSILSKIDHHFSKE